MHFRIRDIINDIKYFPILIKIIKDANKNYLINISFSIAN